MSLPSPDAWRISEKFSIDYDDALPRVPSPAAIKAAKLGLQLFEEADETERIELPRIGGIMLPPRGFTVLSRHGAGQQGA